jgi:dihydrodipicolinate synthase/N-acetylneuraminate lyase
VKKRNLKNAHKLAMKFQPLVDIIFMPPVRNYRARTKYSLELQGVIQNSTVRPPLLGIPEEEKQLIKQTLKDAEFI